MRNVWFFCYFVLISFEASDADFDQSVCKGYLHSVPPPIPPLALSYSTSIEWKLIHQNKTVKIDEYISGPEKRSSIKITKLGNYFRIIFDEYNGQYFIEQSNRSCETHNYNAELITVKDDLWHTTTKQLYTTLKRSTIVYNGTTTIRSTPVGVWLGCLYIFQFDITVQIKFYFAALGWPMPLAPPDAQVPVRLELIGTKNGTDPFYARGDYINFIPNPTFDIQNVQTSPGVFCPRKYPGKQILDVPDSFTTVIEKVNMDLKQVTFETIWFDANRKYARYESKTASGTDDDPQRIIYDFKTGIRYDIDPYMGSCEHNIIQRGDEFVNQTAPGVRIQMESSKDFFYLKNADIQYVGTRYTRNIFCDVWIGVYFDANVNRNFTVEWYFMGTGWIEAIGTALTPGSLVRFDIYAGNVVNPVIHHVHKLDPSPPYLSSFDIGQCYDIDKTMNILIKMKVTGNFHLNGETAEKGATPLWNFHLVRTFKISGLVLSAISQNYIQDNLQEALTKIAFIDNIRISKLDIKYYGTSEIYITGILLDQSDLDNKHIYPPSPEIKHDLSGTFDFLFGVINTPWIYNISSKTQSAIVFTAVGIVPLTFPNDFTTTTTQMTTEGTFQVPTLPHQPKTTSTPIPTPPPPPTTTKSMTTDIKKPITTRSPTTKTTTSATTTKTTKPATTTKTTQPIIQTTPKLVTQQVPCTCPKVTCPVTSTPKPTTPIVCPTTKTTSSPIRTQPIPQTQEITSTQQSTSTVSQVHNASAQKQTSSTSGVSSGAAAGIAIAMIIVGIIIGVVIMRAFMIKYPHGFFKEGFLNPAFDSDDRY